MPAYEYRCIACGTAHYLHRSIHDPDPRPAALDAACSGCGRDSIFRRRFSLAFVPPMQEHWNQSVNKPISSMRQYRDELKRASEEATRSTGIEHNYQPVDMRDTDALGVTNEGIDESNQVRSRRGEPLLSEIR